MLNTIICEYEHRFTSYLDGPIVDPSFLHIYTIIEDLPVVFPIRALPHTWKIKHNKTIRT